MTAAATKVSTTVNQAGVRTIALDDPDRRNALCTELLDDLIDALEHARTAPDTRCVVLSSTHPSSRADRRPSGRPRSTSACSRSC
jgi:enoyl-CoA hydratase/carnithine racemase